MNARIYIGIILAAAALGAVIGFVRGLPDDYVERSGQEFATDYGYRCGDGSEFTLVPSDDMSSIVIVPATSVDYVRETTLRAIVNAPDWQYEGEGIAFSARGATLTLKTDFHGTTTCTSMLPEAQSLFKTR